MRLLEGNWMSDGYGYIISQTSDEFAFYHVTPEVCIPADVSDIAFEDVFDQFRLTSDGNKLLLSTSTEPHEYMFNRIKQLPVTCDDILPNTHAATIDAFLSFVEHHYAFFEVRGIDWRKSRDRLTALKASIHSDLELFEALRAELQHFNDAHVELLAYIDDQPHRFDADPGLIREVIKERADASGSTIKDVSSDFNTNLWIEGIGTTILHGAGYSKANDRIRFGLVSESTGYIALKSMGGFVDAAHADQTEAQSLKLVLDEALNHFHQQDVQNLIIDLSLNSGGYEYLARQLAERFVKRPTDAYTLFPADSDEKYSFEYTLNPNAGPSFEGKVYVMTSEVTVSAAEIAVMCFDAIEGVKIVGEPTRGALSTKLAKLLPNGWELMLSNQVYLDHKGNRIEGIGITPDISFKIWDPENLETSHTDAVQSLAKKIEDDDI